MSWGVKVLPSFILQVWQHLSYEAYNSSGRISCWTLAEACFTSAPPINCSSLRLGTWDVLMEKGCVWCTGLSPSCVPAAVPVANTLTGAGRAGRDAWRFRDAHSGLIIHILHNWPTSTSKSARLLASSADPLQVFTLYFSRLLEVRGHEPALSSECGAENGLCTRYYRAVAAGVQVR